MIPRASFLLTLLSAMVADGGESAHYTLGPAALDYGGLSATSAHYSANSSGSAGGASASTTYTARSGYAGQLSDTTALALTAPSLAMNEGGTLQLSANLLFDDDTTTPLDENAIAWSVSSGPLSGIDAAGLTTAGLVYQDDAAAVQGVYQGFTGTLDLTVLNTDSDNFGSYAGDGLADDWQFDHFGLNNPDAGPLSDPDRDGQNNEFEFIAGLVPTDALSRFSLSVAPVPGQPNQNQVVFDPIVAGRSYTVMTSQDMSPSSWAPLSGGSAVDDGVQRSVTDSAAGGTRKFYTVEIEKP